MKSIWISKTLWVNVLAIVGLFLSAYLGFELTPEITVSVLGGINILLRYITKEEVNWSGN